MNKRWNSDQSSLLMTSSSGEGCVGEAEVEIIGAGISMIYSPCPQSAIIIKAWWISCSSNRSQSPCYSGQFNNLGIARSLPPPPPSSLPWMPPAGTGTSSAQGRRVWSFSGSRWQPHSHKCLEPEEGCVRVAVVCVRVCVYVRMWVCVHECMFKCLSACPLCGII